MNANTLCQIAYPKRWHRFPCRYSRYLAIALFQDTASAFQCYWLLVSLARIASSVDLNLITVE